MLLVDHIQLAPWPAVPESRAVGSFEVAEQPLPLEVGVARPSLLLEVGVAGPSLLLQPLHCKAFHFWHFLSDRALHLASCALI